MATDIEKNWRRKYAWIPPSERPEVLKRWSIIRDNDGYRRTIDGANPYTEQGLTEAPSKLRRGPSVGAEWVECGGEERQRTPLPASSVGPPFSKGVKTDGAS